MKTCHIKYVDFYPSMDKTYEAEVIFQNEIWLLVKVSSNNDDRFGKEIVFKNGVELGKESKPHFIAIKES